MQTERKMKEADRREFWKLSTTNIFQLYVACMDNARELLEEAELLFEHGKYARAFVLAFTAYEEVGKAEIVADFYTECTSEKEFGEAFRKHEVKLAYVNRNVELRTDEPPRIVYDVERAKEIIKARNGALYVQYGDQYTPRMPSVSRKDAAANIVAVERVIAEIEHAVLLNERIGSKAVFK